MRTLRKKEIRTNKRLDILNKIWREVGTAKQLDNIITSITQMARSALNASFSSVYLLDEKTQELFLRCTNAPIENQIGRFQLNKQAGIAGWVAQTGQPLIINDVNKDPRFNGLIDEIYGSPTKSIICAPLISRNRVTGIIKVINKDGGADFARQDLQTLAAIAATAALTVENLKLNECLQDSYKSTVKALVSLSDAKEITGGGHSRRVARYALMGATKLSLPEEEKRNIEYAAILHDIGKLAISDSILNKSGTLTHEEWRILRSHPQISFNLLKEIPFLIEASQLILYHHERYDGMGYPYGLKGEAIPLGARLIAVADAFDNMTTKHAYRDAINTRDAFVELGKCMGSQFCPVAVKAFYAGFLQAHPPAKQ
jgi:putative methionine-R-sulfoxide reductase with GAF domain